MALKFSYAISLSTENNIGNTPSDKHEDEVNSLRQALSNTITNGKVIKLDIALPLTQSRNIDLTSLGLTSIRSVLVKSDQPFGYSPEGTTWIITKSVFMDMGAPLSSGSITSSHTYTSPTIIRLENPATSPSVNIQLLVVGV